MAVVAPIDVETGAIKMRKSRRQLQALSRRSGNKALELRHARGIEGIQGPTERIIIELVGTDAGAINRAVGLLWKNLGTK